MQTKKAVWLCLYQRGVTPYREQPKLTDERVMGAGEMNSTVARKKIYQITHHLAGTHLRKSVLAAEAAVETARKEVVLEQP